MSIVITEKAESGAIFLSGGAWGGSVAPGADLAALQAEGSLPEMDPAVVDEIEAWWAEEVAPGQTRAQRWAEETAEPEPPLEEVKADALHRIDEQAERERLHHITPGAGQMGVYLAKEAAARACLADGDPDPEDYPLLAATIGIERHPVTGDVAQNVTEVATIVLLVAGGWLQIAAAIEAVRLGAKAAIADAATAGEVAAIFPVAWPSR